MDICKNCSSILPKRTPNNAALCRHCGTINKFGKSKHFLDTGPYIVNGPQTTAYNIHTFLWVCSGLLAIILGFSGNTFLTIVAIGLVLLFKIYAPKI